MRLVFLAYETSFGRKEECPAYQRGKEGRGFEVKSRGDKAGKSFAQAKTLELLQ